MLSLTIVGLIVAIIVITSERNQVRQKLIKTQKTLQDIVARRDREWRDYIESFRSNAQSETEHSFLNRLKQGPSSTVRPQTGVVQPQQPTQVQPQQVTTQPTHSSEEPLPDAPPPPPTPQTSRNTSFAVSASSSQSHQTHMNNALILLYLGAFLFVVAAGLFVGFAGFSGELRTLVVAIVAGIFYGGGLYLHRHKPRLKQAGVSFVAIGMAVAPLIGLSLYSYVTDQSYGSLIWLITSAGVFGLYVHALLRLRSSLVGYLVIFSFISLLQSSISILDAPVYYFIWMLIITGLILQVASRYIQQLNLPELKEPVSLSSQVLVPLSVFASVVGVPTEGYVQLAVTFGFASIFYVLSALSEVTEEKRSILYQLSHSMGVLAVATGAFAFARSFTHVAMSLLAITVLHIGVIAFMRSSTLMKLITYNALITTLPLLFFAFESPPLLLSGLCASVALGLVAAFRQERAEGTVLAVLSIGLIPYVLGLQIIEPSLGMGELALLSLTAPIAVGLLREVMVVQQRRTWLQVTSVPFVLVALLSVFPALLSESVVAGLTVGVILGGIFAFLAKLEKNTFWPVLSSLAILTPVVQLAWEGSNPALTASVILAIVWNVGLALYFKSETARWAGSLLWLGLPLAIGVRGFGVELSESAYSWMYIVVFIGFMLARLVVVKREEDNVATSILPTKGVSYAVGYWLASFATFVFALSAGNASQQVSIVCGVLIVAFWVLSRYIEKNPRLVGIVPVLLQILVLALTTPSLDDELMFSTYLIISQIVAVVSYLLYKLQLPAWLKENADWYVPTAAALFIAPVSVFVVGETLLVMPISLAIAGSVIVFENWGRGQATREQAGYIIVAALLWMMWYAGIRNLQAYTHTVAMVFALYALWRWWRQDRKGTDEYLQYMFLIATIPLLLQALYGVSGDVYGWWLIIEQIGFVLLGMLSGRKFLTKWGLYVAIGAVIYQMRELEWAVLSILAVAIIGIAVYYLNRQDADPPSNPSQ